MHDEARLQHLSADGRQRLRHLRTVFEDVFAQRHRQSPRRRVEGAWLRLGGPACLGGPADVADARAFLDLIDKLDDGNRFSLDELERAIADLYAEPDAEAGETLQFMTIHKAKGLEFDTVILPGLHRGTGNGDQPLMLWEEVLVNGPQASLVMAPLRKRGSGGEEPTPYDYLRLLEAERSANEDARTLYVAATRAIRSLHLVGVVTPRADGTLAAPAGSFLRLLWPGVGAAFAAQPAAALADTSRAASEFVSQLVRLADPAQFDGALLFGSPGELQVAAAQAAPAGPVDVLGAHVGTLVHSYLDAIGHDELAAWTPARVLALRPAMAAWLGLRGHDALAAQQGAEACAAALTATLSSADGQWVLAPRATAASELALATSDEGRTQVHVLDRSFVDNGERWIIDFKTVAVADEQAPLRAHAERYRPQLERYAGIFHDDGHPVRLAIFFTACGRLVTLA